MDRDKASDIEHKIAALKRRWPAHSVPAAMWLELEELEEELRKIEEAGNDSKDGRETGVSRLW